MKLAGIIATIAFPVIAVALVSMQMIVGNTLVGDATEIQAIDKTITTLSDDITTLSQEIASASSLLSVRDRAKTIGFVETKRYVSFPKDYMSVAMVNK